MKTKKTLKNKEPTSLISEDVDSLITSKLTLGAGVSSAIDNLFVLDSSESGANEQMNDLQNNVVKWRQKLKLLKPLYFAGSLLIVMGILFCISLSLLNNDGQNTDTNTIVFNNISRTLYQEIGSGGDNGFDQLGTTIQALPSSSPANKQDAMDSYSQIHDKWKQLTQTYANINTLASNADGISTSLQTAYPYVVWNQLGFKNLSTDVANIQRNIGDVINGKVMGNSISDVRKPLMDELYTWAKAAPTDKGWVMAWNSISPINAPLEQTVNGQADWDQANASWEKIKQALQPILTNQAVQSTNNNYFIGLFLIFIGFISLVFSLIIQSKSAKVNETLVVSTNERVANVVAGIMSQLNNASHGDLSNIDEIDEKNANTLRGKINFMITDLAMLVADIKRSVAKTHDVTNDAKKNAGILAEHNMDQSTRMAEMSRQSMDLLDGLEVVETEMTGLKQSVENALATSQVTSKDSEKAVTGLKDIQATFDELKVRVKRLLSYNHEFFELGGWMQDVGDQLEVLAIQAQTQAMKTSGAGANEGFKIVAEDILNLRKQAEEKGLKMMSIIQMTETDSDAVKAYLDNTIKSLSDVSSIVGVKNESSKKMETLILDMNNFMAVLAKSVTAQEKTMSDLKASANIVAKIGDEDKEVVSNALSSFSAVTEIVRTLGHKTQKFKVKS